MSHEFNSGRDSGCKRKAAKLSCITTFRLSRDGGTGRRSGLKIRRASALGGSIPPPGTKLPSIWPPAHDAIVQPGELTHDSVAKQQYADNEHAAHDDRDERPHLIRELALQADKSESSDDRSKHGTQSTQ